MVPDFVKRKYQNDARFRALVQSIVQVLDEGATSAYELHDAVELAKHIQADREAYRRRIDSLMKLQRGRVEVLIPPLDVKALVSSMEERIRASESLKAVPSHDPLGRAVADEPIEVQAPARAESPPALR